MKAATSPRIGPGSQHLELAASRTHQRLLRPSCHSVRLTALSPNVIAGDAVAALGASASTPQVGAVGQRLFVKRSPEASTPRGA